MQKLEAMRFITLEIIIGAPIPSIALVCRGGGGGRRRRGRWPHRVEAMKNAVQCSGAVQDRGEQGEHHVWRRLLAERMPRNGGGEQGS
ncbi:hypothetical protein COCNU_scaffold013888G000010 [Cocos nucifera]|nr:hypothetical protein [Cocos nucifera]